MRIADVTFSTGVLNPDPSDPRAPRRPRITFIADASARWATLRWRGRWWQVYCRRSFRFRRVF